MTQMEYRWLYMTAEDRDEALRLGRSLVEERLVACVNVFDGATSLYWWDGNVQQEGETILVAKTCASRVERVIERVKELHSYDCPCVVALPIVGGNSAFLQWIGDQCSSS